MAREDGSLQQVIQTLLDKNDVKVLHQALDLLRRTRQSGSSPIGTTQRVGHSGP